MTVKLQLAVLLQEVTFPVQSLDGHSKAAPNRSKTAEDEDTFMMEESPLLLTWM